MSALLEETVEIPALLLKREAARHLRRSVRTIERMLDAGDLQKVGGGKAGGSTVLITASSVNRWVLRELATNTASPTSEADRSPVRARPLVIDGNGLAFGPLIPNETRQGHDTARPIAVRGRRQRSARARSNEREER